MAGTSATATADAALAGMDMDLDAEATFLVCPCACGTTSETACTLRGVARFIRGKCEWSYWDHRLHHKGQTYKASVCTSELASTQAEVLSRNKCVNKYVTLDSEDKRSHADACAGML